MANLATKSKVLTFPCTTNQFNNEGAILEVNSECGFCKLPNQLLQALCKTSLSDRESRIVMAIIAKTVGYGKEMDWISNSQLSELTNIDVNNVSKAKLPLIERNILIAKGKKLGVNPETSEWLDKTKKVDSDCGKKSVSTVKKVDSDCGKKSVSTAKKVDSDCEKGLVSTEKKVDSDCAKSRNRLTQKNTILQKTRDKSERAARARKTFPLPLMIFPLRTR